MAVNTEHAMRHLVHIISGLTLDEAIQEAIQKSWLQVLEGIVCMNPMSDPRHSDRLERALDVWREIGGVLWVEEHTLVAERGRLRLKAMRGLNGCSWVRCALHLDDGSYLRREMLRCSQCHKVSE